MTYLHKIKKNKIITFMILFFLMNNYGQAEKRIDFEEDEKEIIENLELLENLDFFLSEDFEDIMNEETLEGSKE